tara:strand:- start:336 stop:542 length:207 start_codon:yes stop_codon:yes gene_type:complete
MRHSCSGRISASNSVVKGEEEATEEKAVEEEASDSVAVEEQATEEEATEEEAADLVAEIPCQPWRTTR